MTGTPKRVSDIRANPLIVDPAIPPANAESSILSLRMSEISSSGSMFAESALRRRRT